MENTKSLNLYRALAFVQIDKIAVVLTMMYILPFLFHMIPPSSALPLGAVWLPIFYAPLVAVIFFRAHVALLAAMVAPTINMLLTGRPAADMAKTLTIELTIFVIIAQLLHKRFKQPFGIGVISYVFAKFLTSGVNPEHFLRSAYNALPGIIVLLLIPFRYPL